MSNTLISDLKRQLAAERDYGKRLQKQLDAILRTDGPDEANDEAVRLLRAWVAGCGDERYSTKEQVKSLIDKSGAFLASLTAGVEKE